jgi:hypothetical protein
MHMYHDECISAWLARSHVCPVCQVRGCVRCCACALRWRACCSQHAAALAAADTDGVTHTARPSRV